MASSPMLLVLAVGVLATACTPELVDPTPPGLSHVATLDVSASRDTLYLTDTLRLGVESHDSAGNLLRGHAVAWTSDAPLVVSVAPNGLVTAVGAGAATVEARSGGIVGNVHLVVRKLVFSVNVVPDAVCLRKGFSTTVSLTAYDSLGQVVSSGVRPVVWKSSNGQVGTVVPQDGDSALVLGVAAGVINVSGSLMGVADSTGFIIDPAPLGSPLTCGG